jgi:hypothetical protein
MIVAFFAFLWEVIKKSQEKKAEFYLRTRGLEK